MLSKRADFDTGGVKFCCTAVPFSTLATSLLLAVSADISSESENSLRSITSQGGSGAASAERGHAGGALS